jgi:hypothetical protein
MKKLFLLVLGLIVFKFGYSQYPIQQFIGADSAIVTSKGAMQSRFVNVVFTDTSQANTQRIRQYPGAMIYAAGKMWVRNTTATGWTELAYGPISTTNIYNSDGTLTGNRELDGNSNNLTFTAVKKFEFSGDSLYYILDPAGNLRIKLGNQQLTMQGDTASLSRRISYTGNLGSSFTKHSIVDKNYVDSVASVASGTVTSVATNNGTGITGGTITTTGTLSIDTALISTRAWRQKGIDSVTSLINARPSGSGTTNYVSKWTSSTALGNSLLTDISNTLTYEASLGNASFNIKSPSGYYYPSINLFSNNTLAATILGYNGRLYLTAAGNAGIWFGNATTTQMLLTNSGRLLIGTTTESTYELDVVGDIRSTLDANINGLTVGKGGGNNANNTAFGVSALGSNTTGTQNVAIGVNALGNNTTANFNVAIGFQAGQLITQNSNTAVGYYAGYANNTGYENTAIGSLSQRFCASGYQNTTVGVNSGYGITSGNRNTFFGTNSGYDITTGTFNTMVGSGAAGNGVTTGSFNTIIGSQITGLSSSLSNTIILADGQGNQRLYINSSGNVGIATTNPATYRLDVNGTFRATSNGYFGAPVSINSTTSPSNVELYVVANAPASRIRYQSTYTNGVSIYQLLNDASVEAGLLLNGSTATSSNEASVYSTGVFNVSGSIVKINTNSLERMRVFNNGNIAINTTTDAGYKLDVNGTARTTGSTSLATTSGQVAIGTASPLAGWTLYNAGNFRQEGNMAVFGTLQVGNISQPGGAMTINIISSLGRNITFVDGSGSTNGDYVRFFSTNTIGNITSGTANLLLVNPTINQTTGAGTIIGYRFNPTNTALVSSVYSFYADSGTAYFGSNVGIGTTSPNASALLDVSSTTKGFLPPRMTNAQMVAIATPAAGLVVYDTTNNKLNVYDGTNWVTLH